MKFSNFDVVRIAYRMNLYQNNMLAENGGTLGLAGMVYNYRNRGFSPRRFRADLRRAAVPNKEWIALLDATPGCTDEHIDTMLRRAVAMVLTRDNWAAKKEGN